MTRETERRLLQLAVALGCLSPFWFGLRGMIEGPAMLEGVEPGQAAADLLSHYRYLSGLFLGIGLVLASCVRRIEARTIRFRWACAAILVGGLARAAGLAMGDAPSAAHLVALAAELGVVPLLLLWQARVARRFGQVTRR
ncbi:MAG TPA: DUF4345 domain-containing protein [Allosphingosinicella sp.]|nr:DUF4345 domain-containing protein [Allosphingosinicella sp.]